MSVSPKIDSSAVPGLKLAVMAIVSVLSYRQTWPHVKLSSTHREVIKKSVTEPESFASCTTAAAPVLHQSDSFKVVVILQPVCPVVSRLSHKHKITHIQNKPVIRLYNERTASPVEPAHHHL